MPKRLKARRKGAGKILLKWKDKSSNEDGFIIERKVEKNGDWMEIDRTVSNVKKFIDSDVTKGKTHFYRIRAFNDSAAAYYSVYSKETYVKAK